MTPQEFSAKIKAKYPDYAGIDDLELARKIVAKYPDYASQVDFVPQPPPQDFDIGTRSATVSAQTPPYLASGMAGYTPDVNVTRALLTNEPTQGKTEAILRSIPTTGLGVAGGTAGTVAGPLGNIAGATLGGSAGEAARQMAASLYSAYRGEGELSRPTGVLGEVALQGVLQGAGVGIGEGAAIAGRAIKPTVVRLGSQLLRAGPGIPEKYGQAALQDLSSLSRAPSKEEISAAYRNFEQSAGLTSPKVIRAQEGNLIQKASQAEETVNRVYSKLINSNNARAVKMPDGSIQFNPTEQVTAQELYEASQAARFLKDHARFGDPNQLSNLSNINQAKTAIDDALEAIHPGYNKLRQDTFLSKTAEQFQSAFPLNKNLSPNVLRTQIYLTGSIGGAVATGNPLPLLAPLAISPKAAGLAIRGAYRTGQAIEAISPSIRFSPGSISNYYRSPGIQGEQP